jgi:hypothetical protein
MEIWDAESMLRVFGTSPSPGKRTALSFRIVGRRMNDGSEKPLDDDARLMLQSAFDSIPAFEKLYKKYLPIVIDYLASLNGHQEPLDDLASEVFIRLWRKRQRFRGASTFNTYLFAVTTVPL